MCRQRNEDQNGILNFHIHKQKSINNDNNLKLKINLYQLESTLTVLSIFCYYVILKLISPFDKIYIFLCKGQTKKM